MKLLSERELQKNYPRSLTNCIFCGCSPTTKEHVFSHWTHKFLPPRVAGKTEVIQGIKFIDKSDFRMRKLPGELCDWQIKCVCGGASNSCNNGWMRSKVEEPAIKVLSDLILGNEVRILPDQQMKIASWATLKCMIAEYESGGFVTTHQMQRKRLMKRQLPPSHGWGIWIGACPQNTRRLSWQSSAYLVKPSRLLHDINAAPKYYNGQSSTMLIGKLLIQVVRGPIGASFNRWNFQLVDGGQLFKIWPPSSLSIKWPPKTLSIREVNMTISSVENTLLNIAKKRIMAKPAS